MVKIFDVIYGYSLNPTTFWFYSCNNLSISLEITCKTLYHFNILIFKPFNVENFFNENFVREIAKVQNFNKIFKEKKSLSNLTFSRWQKILKPNFLIWFLVNDLHIFPEFHTITNLNTKMICPLFGLSLCPFSKREVFLSVWPNSTEPN